MRKTHLPTVLALMPAEVQSGIREVSKTTMAKRSDKWLETVPDKLFLLSEVETFGSTGNSAAGEGSQNLGLQLLRIQRRRRTDQS